MDLKIIAMLVGIGISGAAGYFIGKSRCGGEGKKRGRGGMGMHHAGMHGMGKMHHGGAMGLYSDPDDLMYGTAGGRGGGYGGGDL